MGSPTLGAGEIRRMLHAENIVKAYNGKYGSKDWVEWANKYPTMNRILIEAEKLVNEDGD